MPEFVSYDFVDEVLSHLAAQPNAAQEDIATALWARFSSVQGIVQLCENRGALRRDRQGVHLADVTKTRLKIKPSQVRGICRECGGRGISVPVEEFRQQYQDLLARRVEPDKARDQWTADMESVYARVAYLIGDRATRRRRVLFLGDDDFASVGVALYGDPEEVVVVDSDPRLANEVLPSIAAQESLRLQTVLHDLREPLPQRLRGTFDATFGDPPYALRGIITWLQRSIEALKPTGRGYLAVPYHDALLQGSTTLAEIVGFLHSNEFVITDMIHGFHSYEGIDGQRSSMLRFERIQRQHRPRDSFYWGEELHAQQSAERILNRPLIPDEVVAYIDYLAGLRGDYPAPPYS